MQRFIRSVFILLQIYVFNNITGLEYGKQQERHNANTDFLLHEGNPHPSQPKRDYVVPQFSSNTVSQNKQTLNQNDFPPLRTSPTPSLPPSTVHNTKKTDYPPLKSTLPNSSKSNNNGYTTSLSGKRDYVASQFTTRSTGPTSGKVKDLINFYDNKDKKQNSPQKSPSYSSIVQGSNGINKPMSSTTKAMQPVTSSTHPTNYTPKPASFSSVVAGSKPSNTATTPKPHNAHPGRPNLPSIVSNNNKGNQASNQNSPSDSDLQILSEELLRKDSNNAAKYITVNYQGKTTSSSKEDKAPSPLLTIKNDVWNIPTVEKFLPLLDNYERDTLVNEYVTPQERNEENAFLDAIMSTTVIRHLMNFFKEKGYVTPDPKQQRDFLKQLWFSLYSRGKGKISSSGFEHVFVSELKNGEVSGLHNWIYFSKEETASRVNYLGYLKYEVINDKGVVMKLHFNQQGTDKPVDSMFIGTSPELEIALYTLCFVTRADNECKLKLGGKDVDIRTHTFRYRSKNLIGSAFPQI
ncbi:endoribonuclease CG2145 [Amyelois transitella]|uniref:endoribonuclease CG2145 n=1 Tax=Amyelois transitella TaxID=680683 RepID=UPI00298FB973|nr:endoribonuclease CG2145 [Amyelois transitella]